MFDERQADRAVAIIKQHVLDVSDVTGADVEILPSDRSERTLNLLIRLQTIYGSGETTVEVG